MSVKRYQPVAQCVEPSYQAQMIEAKVMEFSEGEYVLYSDYKRLLEAGNAMDNAISEIDPQRLERHRFMQMTDAEYIAVMKWRTTKDPTYNRA